MERNKLRFANVLRAFGVLCWIVGACWGWDEGSRQFIDGTQVVDYFSLSGAFGVWFCSLGAGLLFWALGKLMDLLDK